MDSGQTGLSWEKMFEESINQSLYLPEPDSDIRNVDSGTINLPPELSASTVAMNKQVGRLLKGKSKINHRGAVVACLSRVSTSLYLLEPDSYIRNVNSGTINLPPELSASSVAMNKQVRKLLKGSSRINHRGLGVEHRGLGMEHV